MFRRPQTLSLLALKDEASHGFLVTSREKIISPEQCRKARSGLGLNADALAKLAGASKVTPSDFELGKRSPHSRTIAAIRAALEAAWIEFIVENGGDPGVRLCKGGPDAASTTIPVEHLNAENDE